MFGEMDQLLSLKVETLSFKDFSLIFTSDLAHFLCFFLCPPRLAKVYASRGSWYVYLFCRQTFVSRI